MTHKGTVRLETERLILRRYTIDDLEEMYYNCWRHYDVWKWTNYAPMKCIEDVQKAAGMFTDSWLGMYERPNRYSWAITLRSTGEVIGRFFGMHPDDRVRQIELAYELGPAFWGHGYMTEAARAVIDFFFREVGFNRVYAYHVRENPASGRIMQKCGMKYEGTLRQAGACNGGAPYDICYYSILADEYLPRDTVAYLDKSDSAIFT